MDPRSRLATNLVAESEAYGYTLTIWGAGAMLIHRFGIPNFTEVFLFVGGSLLGFAGLGAIAFEKFVMEPGSEGSGQVVVASMVHVVATLGNLALAYLLLEFTLRYGFPDWTGFLLVGFQATLVYNVLLLLEDFLTKRFVEVAPFVDDVEEVE